MKEESYGIIPYRIDKGGVSILLYKTSTNSPYNFFKGKRESSESIIDTTIRETFEETGVVLKKSDLEDYFFHKNRRKDIGLFLVCFNDIDTFSFCKREIFETKWVYLDKIPTISDNQRLFVTDILVKFSFIHFLIAGRR